MTAIPSKSSFTGASVTEGDYKTAFETMHDYLTGVLGAAGTQAAALATLGVLGNSVSTRSSAYTVSAADRGHAISCTGTFTLSLTSAATLGAGFVVAAINSGSGVITIDPSGTETISGNSTWALDAGDGVAAVSNGSVWLVFASHKAQPYSPRGVQVFQSNGNFHVPKGVSQLRVTAFGGGGGGNGSNMGAINGGKGGAGIAIIAVTPESQIPVTVGSGGAGANLMGTGGAGGTTAFGSYVTATGGSSTASGVFSTTGALLIRARNNLGIEVIGGSAEGVDSGSTDYGRGGGSGMSGGGAGPFGSLPGIACGPGSDGGAASNGYAGAGGGPMGGAASTQRYYGGGGGGSGGVIVEW